MTQQPKWKLIDNQGDANPLDYGGYFIYEDETGVYEAEAELLVPEDEGERDGDQDTLMVYRFILDRCTFIDGILSDNKYHPFKPAWFAKPESERAERPQDTTYLKNVADYCGESVESLIKHLCSEKPVDRAVAYRAIADYHGWENFDSYPLELTRAEAEERYPQYA